LQQIQIKLAQLLGNQEKALTPSLDLVGKI